MGIKIALLAYTDNLHYLPPLPHITVGVSSRLRSVRAKFSKPCEDTETKRKERHARGRGSISCSICKPGLSSKHTCPSAITASVSSRLVGLVRSLWYPRLSIRGNLHTFESELTRLNGKAAREAIQRLSNRQC